MCTLLLHVTIQDTNHSNDCVMLSFIQNCTKLWGAKSNIRAFDDFKVTVVKTNPALK